MCSNIECKTDILKNSIPSVRYLNTITKYYYCIVPILSLSILCCVELKRCCEGLLCHCHLASEANSWNICWKRCVRPIFVHPINTIKSIKLNNARIHLYSASILQIAASVDGNVQLLTIGMRSFQMAFFEEVESRDPRRRARQCRRQTGSNGRSF